MSKRIITLFSLIIVASMVLAACGGGASKAPAECADNPDETVCAVFAPVPVIILASSDVLNHFCHFVLVHSLAGCGWHFS